MTNTNLAGRIGRWSTQHRKKAIFGWLAFVIVSLTVGFNLVRRKRSRGSPGCPAKPDRQPGRSKARSPTRLRSRFLFRARTARRRPGSRTRLEM